jgi:hypothetical protein
MIALQPGLAGFLRGIAAAAISFALHAMSLGCCL